jgi:aldose 1-epimerase
MTGRHSMMNSSDYFKGSLMAVKIRPFGAVTEGQVARYEMTSNAGVTVAIMNYGATLVSLNSPDRQGDFRNIILSHDRLDDYLSDGNFLGVIVGRYANRIAGAAFSLAGTEFSLPANDGRNHLHGGPGGFHRKLWQAEIGQADTGSEVRLSLTSPHLDQGYPGNLTSQVTYRLSDDGTLAITMTATSDRPTVVNMTNHSYFNLSGTENILDHRLRLDCSAFTPGDEGLIPTGDIFTVENTPFDFRQTKAIGLDLQDEHPQLNVAGGYDHNFVVDGAPGKLRPVAELSDPHSGRQVAIRSTQPGVQFYTGNNLVGPFQRHGGLCLETQHFPDSPNQPAFPSTEIGPEKPYREIIEYRFGTIT